MCRGPRYTAADAHYVNDQPYRYGYRAQPRWMTTSLSSEHDYQRESKLDGDQPEVGTLNHSSSQQENYTRFPIVSIAAV